MLFAEIGVGFQRGLIDAQGLAIFDRLIPYYWRELSPYVAAAHLEFGFPIDVSKPLADQKLTLFSKFAFAYNEMVLRGIARESEMQYPLQVDIEHERLSVGVGNVRKSERRWLIVGTGGIGGYFGGLLARAGYDVTFLARGENLKAMQADGLRVEAVDQSFAQAVRAVESVENDSPYDVVLFCVKTYDNETASRAVLPAVGSGTVVISIQNGLGNDRQLQEIFPGAVYPGLAHIVSARISPGVVRQSGGPRTVFFGEPGAPANETLQSIASEMQAAGIDATAADNILDHQWNKFVFIVAFSGMTSYCRCPIGPILHDPVAKDVFRRCAAEAVAVAKASGVDMNPGAVATAMERAEAYLGKQEGATSSMFRDLVAGRPTEVDSLNGAVVAQAAAHDVDVPVNSAIYAAVRLADAARLS